MKHNEFRLVQFTSFGFFFVWLDVCIGHLSAVLFKFYMAVPLVFLPCATAVAIVTALWSTKLNRILFTVISILAILIGLIGFYFHFLKFQQSLVGSMEWQVIVRFMRYPPIFAPFAVTGIGILGLMVNRK